MALVCIGFGRGVVAKPGLSGLRLLSLTCQTRRRHFVNPFGLESQYETLKRPITSALKQASLVRDRSVQPAQPHVGLDRPMGTARAEWLQSVVPPRGLAAVDTCPRYDDEETFPHHQADYESVFAGGWVHACR